MAITDKRAAVELDDQWLRCLGLQVRAVVQWWGSVQAQARVTGAMSPVREWPLGPVPHILAPDQVRGSLSMRGFLKIIVEIDAALVPITKHFDAYDSCAKNGSLSAFSWVACYPGEIGAYLFKIVSRLGEPLDRSYLICCYKGCSSLSSACRKISRYDSFLQF